MMEQFRVKAYGKSELAMLYSPNCSPAAARRKFMSWIALQPALVSSLTAAGYYDKIYTFIPVQVQMIIGALGEP